MTTVRELYEESIRYEEKTLAHYILHLLQEGKVSLEDDADSLDLTQADHEKVAAMILQNQLGFSDIRIFSLKYDNKQFAFIFAANEEEAIEFFQKIFKRNPYNCHEYPLDFPMSRGNEFLTFRDMKKEYSRFPALAGFYERR
ncbi:hypothetical protein P4S93_07375 [Aneurinibacillus thermoaerophilus]|uniref:Uncharacterized protein n=1 Tax=Aneurinibacillus thermoaerophilus TaxID=143495 RepID=A0A1G8AP37_ANETH|nr:hypothetical protein [Aneurinibacillus thermoaerophilus]MED0758754.1 hypothetical protein [Aneurinibacillus thermoaerophilus]MED0760592.1 hypothetical protein [Aneurinibacillus thermoaerophilus]SDH22812.1 hypothetical protein SAMN04489735_101730 [Aneurinibacillus thermoaerophilus]